MQHERPVADDSWNELDQTERRIVEALAIATQSWPARWIGRALDMTQGDAEEVARRLAERGILNRERHWSDDGERLPDRFRLAT